MRSAIILPFIAGALLGSAALAQQGGQQAAPAKADDEKLVCRYEPVTGSLAGRVKRCLTEKQRREIARGAREDTEKMRGGGFTCADGTRPCQ